MEIRRTGGDILGNVEVENQYNFGLYYVFEKSPGDDVGATVNADWIMDFQEWVQEQSIRGTVPKFGDKQPPPAHRTAFCTRRTKRDGHLYGAAVPFL